MERLVVSSSRHRKYRVERGTVKVGVLQGMGKYQRVSRNAQPSVFRPPKAMIPLAYVVYRQYGLWMMKSSPTPPLPSPSLRYQPIILPDSSLSQQLK
jgi:hypothetical protein